MERGRKEVGNEDALIHALLSSTDVCSCCDRMTCYDETRRKDDESFGVSSLVTYGNDPINVRGPSSSAFVRNVLQVPDANWKLLLTQMRLCVGSGF